LKPVLVRWYEIRCQCAHNNLTDVICYVTSGEGLTLVVSLQQTTSCRNYSWTRCFKNCFKISQQMAKLCRKL